MLESRPSNSAWKPSQAIAIQLPIAMFDLPAAASIPRSKITAIRLGSSRIDGPHVDRLVEVLAVLPAVNPPLALAVGAGLEPERPALPVEGASYPARLQLQDRHGLVVEAQAADAGIVEPVVWVWEHGPAWCGAVSEAGMGMGMGMGMDMDIMCPELTGSSLRNR